MVAASSVTLPKPIRPFLKWAGGKSALIKQFAPHFPHPDQYTRYFEPFLGGGAVFFHLQPVQSLLFDLNSELIDLYRTLRDDVESVISALAPHRNDRAYFEQIRAIDPQTLSMPARAARFIFLNRTCYNGLYRVNNQGQFNVPFGRYAKPNICDSEGLHAASLALKNAEINLGDFKASVESCQAGDFIYFDPPYAPLSATSRFISYTKHGFDAADQKRLAEWFRELDRRGCLLMLSNSSAPLIYDLYKGFPMHEIAVRRMINSKGEGRGLITELLITNFTPKKKIRG
jgi:DNA adenine methylase